MMRYTKGKKILLVEDEEIVRIVCAAVLERNGFEYIVATNGAEGVEAYRDRHKEVCLVLADVSMPVKGGIEMFREIRDIDPHANVILMSGYSISEIVSDDIRRLCSVLCKPFTASSLIASVRKCLEYDAGRKVEAVGVRS